MEALPLCQFDHFGNCATGGSAGPRSGKILQWVSVQKNAALKGAKDTIFSRRRAASLERSITLLQHDMNFMTTTLNVFT